MIHETLGFRIQVESVITGAYWECYKRVFSVVIERDKEGYFAFCPELQGCYTQGDTYEEVFENIQDAIRLTCWIA